MDRNERREAAHARREPSRDKAAEVVVEIVDEPVASRSSTPGKPEDVAPPTEALADRLTKIEERLTGIEETLQQIGLMVDSGLYQGRVPKGRALRQAP